MSLWKRVNALLIVLLVGIFCLYGCSYQDSAFVHEKSPDYHGHVEEKPGARHQRMHQQGEPKVAYEKECLPQTTALYP